MTATTATINSKIGAELGLEYATDTTRLRKDSCDASERDLRIESKDKHSLTRVVSM
jgi:hypothetical protein